MEKEVYMNLFSISTTTLIFLVLFVLSGFYSKAQSEPAILFSRGYVNYAWGYEKRGLNIDNTGSIDTFKMYIRGSFRDSLRMKMNNTILQDTMKIMSALILEIDTNNVTKSDGGWRDYGLDYYSTFMYDSVKQKYTEIILSATGDQKITNNSKAAKTIVEWLSTIKGNTIQTKIAENPQKKQNNHFLSQGCCAAANGRFIYDIRGRCIGSQTQTKGVLFLYNSQFKSLTKILQIRK